MIVKMTMMRINQTLSHFTSIASTFNTAFILTSDNSEITIFTKASVPAIFNLPILGTAFFTITDKFYSVTTHVGAITVRINTRFINLEVIVNSELSLNWTLSNSVHD